MMATLSGLLVGLLVGVVLHRGDFCMHSALREAVAGRPDHNVRAYLLALAIQAAAVNGVASLGWLVIVPPPVAPAATLVGGVLFGLGMVLGKG